MKKNQAVIFFFCFIVFKTSLPAQYCDTVSFQKIIWNEGIHDATISYMFYSAGGNAYAIGSTESAINKSKDIWIMKMTVGGNVIWSKAIGLSGDETINGVRHTADGGFVMAGNTNSAAKFNEGLIVKVDSNAVVQWSVIVGPQYCSLSSVTQLDDNTYVADGSLYTDFSGDSSGNIKDVSKRTNIIIRLNANGNVLWWKSFRYSASEGLKTSAQSEDGSIYVTGIGSKTDNGYIIKLSKDNGAIQWMNEYNTLHNNVFSRIINQKDGSIHLQVGNRIFFLTADGKFFDGRKIELNSKKIDLDNATVGHIGSLSGNTEIYDANLYPKHSPILFAVQNDSVVVWAHEYKQSDDNLQRISNTLIHNNSIYIAGVYVTNNVSDNLPGENLTYLIKADQNGSTLCSDTFSVSFKVDVIPYPENITHTWINEGNLQFQFVHPYTENLTGKTMLDCDVQNCCKPFLKDTTVALCKGADYFLPPNDSLVTTNGKYSFHYYTSHGCDSTLNYNVNFKQLYRFNLNDTCLVNNQPVTFALPYDSTTIYKWNDGSSAKNFMATVPGKYWVTATSACNIFSDTVNVSAACSLPVYIPSAFTPNGDGLNDVFKIEGLNGQRTVALSVYNRYGNNIFFSNNSGEGWNGIYNGKPQSPGTYIYIFRYSDLEGILHTIKGTVVLLR